MVLRRSGEASDRNFRTRRKGLSSRPDATKGGIALLVYQFVHHVESNDEPVRPPSMRPVLDEPADPRSAALVAARTGHVGRDQIALVAQCHPGENALVQRPMYSALI
eukprot:Opistho-2@37804